MDTNRKLLFFSFVFLCLAGLCFTSDFLGAMIFWKPSADGKSIDIDNRQSWRRTSQSPECDSNTMAYGYNYSAGSLSQTHPVSNFSVTFSEPFTYQCTDYSINEDWQSGRGHISFPIDNSIHYYELEYTGCCWNGTLAVGSGSSWTLHLSINTTIRKDTGRINSSPRIDFPPIVQLQFGCNHTIHLPVSDEDGDHIRCRFASTFEASNIAGALSDANLDQDTCTLYVDSNIRTGWFPIAIQIEDYNYNISPGPLSTIPLQFLVSVESNSSNCMSVESNSTNCTVFNKERQKFVEFTLPDKACVGVVNGTDFTTNITVQSRSGGSISEVNTISPIGLVKSSLQKSNLTGYWHISVKWNPNKTDTVNNVFCFTAVNDAGLSSGQRCITLLAGVPPANVIPSSRSPPDSILSTSQRVWAVTFDQESKRPTIPAYIYLYYGNGTFVEKIDVTNSSGVRFTFHNDTATLQFTTSSDLLPGHDYYFLLGQGLVQGKSLCGAGSKAVLDPTFWTFSTYPDSSISTEVKVRCYKGIYETPCKSSYITCKDQLNFPSPCTHANVDAGHIKFPHPESDNKFVTCDLSGKTYIAYCPPGQIFHADCSECAPRNQILQRTCRKEVQGVNNPCSTSRLVNGKVLFPFPGSENKYIYCDSWGHAWEQSCDLSFIWDQPTETCIDNEFAIIG